MFGRGSKVMVSLGTASLLASGPAAAASKPAPSSYSPWAALSAFASPASSQALCGVAVAGAAAASAQSAAPGCVLPVVDAPPPIPVSEAAPVAVPVAAAGGGIGVLPLLLGLAALAGVAALLLGRGGDDDDVIVGVPVSPG